jgi:aldehyde dehydrogenase (NAD+)
VADPRVGKVSFTGGIRAAQSMMAAGAPLLKPFCFELGGKSANLVFADADMKTAIDSVLISMGNAGQSCKFPSRVLIEDSVYEDVLDRLCAGLASLPVGDPSHESTIVGPLVTDQAQQRVLGMIEETRKNARLRLGGGRPKLPDDLRGGYFVEPTVLDEVDPQSPLAQEEVFGPVVAVFRFTSEEEAIELANSTPWGLSGYIQTTDLARAHRVAAELVTGTIHINGSNLANAAMPFGGYGISGLGREGGRPGLDEFLRTKSVSLP